MDRARRVEGGGGRWSPRLMALGLVWGWGSAVAEVVIEAAAPPGVDRPAAVGRARVPGLGELLMEAQADGATLTLWARDAQGLTLGQGQTVTGTRESEVYVGGPRGLERILIRWPRPQGGGP